jgi:hypothetical protein
MKNLPIGIQSFEDLRKNDYIYIDKTQDIHRLIATGKIYFLSRPRRFGKSLLISTLEAVFRGRKELFEGLFIFDKWDWTQRNPVIRIDFSGLSHRTTEALTNSLSDLVKTTASRNKIVLESTELPDKFRELIAQLHESTGQKVVVLVDEYDKPITDHLSDPETMKSNQKILHDFYQVLKAADEHIRFVFMTGVSKFSGLSIFSALNSLNDITLNYKYASICGYTQEELECNFTEYLDDVAQYLSMNKEELLNEIRLRYNGYSWDGKTTVYNPFSILLFFDNREFDNYWFRTGTPTFLINMLKSRNQIKPVLSPIIADTIAFNSYDPLNIGEIPLLFQTGYLTIKQKILVNNEPQYTLDLPNWEVRFAFMNYLLSAYSDYPVEQVSPLLYILQQQLRDHDAAGFEQNLRLLFAHIPYELHIKSEAYYHSLFLLLMKMLGFDIHGEVTTNIGRIDAVWHQPELTVVAEIKYGVGKDADSLLNEALSQIRDRRYYEKYLDKKVIRLGIAFTGKEVKCGMEEVEN